MSSTMHIRCVALVTKRLASPTRINTVMGLTPLAHHFTATSVDLRRLNAAADIASPKSYVLWCDNLNLPFPTPLHIQRFIVTSCAVGD
jgi:hypothetical protein